MMNVIIGMDGKRELHVYIEAYWMKEVPMKICTVSTPLSRSRRKETVFFSQYVQAEVVISEAARLVCF
jgi:hypothetical protein